MCPKELYIHIGMPKTGSTSIQTCFLANGEFFQEKGVFYPSSTAGHTGHTFIDKDVNATWGVSSTSEVLFEKLLDEIVQTRAKTVFVSGESFMSVDVSKFKRLFALFEESHCIIYVRNFFSFSHSLLQEVAKAPFAYCLEDMYAQTFLPDTLCGWFKYFSNNRCIVKNFDKICKSGVLVEDILHTIGINDFTGLSFPLKENVGLKSPYVFFLRHLAQLPFDNLIWSFLVHEIQVLSCADTDAPVYSLLPPSVLENLHIRIEKQIEWEAKLLDDVTWPEYCWRQRDRLPPCPYTQLPSDEQHRIFDALPKYLSNAIVQAWPAVLEAKNNEPLLPPLFENEAINKILFRWRRIAFERQILTQNTLKSREAQLNNLAARALNFDFVEYVYRLSSMHGIIPLQHIQNMHWDGTALNFTSVGNDPICLLPDISIPDGKICIIQVSATGPCLYWQLFYCTDLYEFHSEVRSLNFDPTSTLNNMCGAVIVLPSDALGNNIRLDPGTKCGQCSIKKLNVFIV